MFAWQYLRCIRVPVTALLCLFVCLSSKVVSMKFSPAAVFAVGQCLKNQVFYHYHLSRFPRVVCFSSLFPCGAEVMCFGTVHLLLDKASENDLSINVPSGPQHG